MAESAAARYAALEPDRQGYLDRARNCSKLTIPSLMPDEGSSGTTTFPTPWQSIGARGVNSLAAKLLLALFPPNAPFLKMEVDDLTAQELSGVEGAKDEIDKALSAYVRRVMTEAERRAIRTDIFEALRLKIVSGNAAIYVPDEGRCRVYRLDKYVVKRDPAGNLLEGVIKETIAAAAVPEEVRKALPEKKAEPKADGTVVVPDDRTHDLFTYVRLNGGEYVVHQEIEGVTVPGSEGSYAVDELPYLFLRFSKSDGESYGRSYVEEYLGDLSALEQLSKSVIEFVAIASRVIPLVNPHGFLEIDDLAKAENGEPIAGTRDDLHFLQIERYNDFRVAKEMIDELEQRLSFAFLLNTAIQRPGERVTAEEIRYMAQELESTLGGVYSLQAQELQLPLAKVFIRLLEASGQLPELPKNAVEPKVVTGMDALGRGNDLSNLMQFIGAVQNNPSLAQAINWAGFAQRLANGLNIETNGLLKTPEQIAQEQQQAMMMQMMDRLGPNAVTQMGQMAQNQMEPPAQ